MDKHSFVRPEPVQYQTAHIYALLDGDEVMYVGQTTREVRVRIQEHRRQGKPFTDWKILETLRHASRNEVFRAEARWMRECGTLNRWNNNREGEWGPGPVYVAKERYDEWMTTTISPLKTKHRIALDEAEKLKPEIRCEPLTDAWAQEQKSKAGSYKLGGLALAAVLFFVMFGLLGGVQKEAGEAAATALGWLGLIMLAGMGIGLLMFFGQSGVDPFERLKEDREKRARYAALQERIDSIGKQIKDAHQDAPPHPRDIQRGLDDPR